MNELSWGLISFCCEEEGDDGEEDRISDFRDEVFLVIRELDEYELDYDEEVFEELIFVV